MNRIWLPFFMVGLSAGHSVANAADVANVYGRLHFSVLDRHGKDININNAGHRLGVKGATKLDSGNEGFYKLETEYGSDRSGKGTSTTAAADDANLVVRHAYAGLETKFGTFTIGRMNNPLNSTYLADMFEYNSGWYEQAKFRIGNTLLYNSKPIGPATFFASVTAEGQGTDGEQEDADAYVIGGQTKLAGFNVALAYMRDKVEDGSGATLVQRNFKDISLGISYSKGAWYGAVNLERSTDEDPTTGDDTEVSVIDTAILYSVDSISYGFGYATADTDLDAGVDPDRASRFLVGVYAGLGGNSDTYLEIGHFKDSDDPNNIVLGYRMSF